MSDLSVYHSLNRVNLYEQIADMMEQAILDDQSDDWRDGCKLPGEQVLANRFGVSRNVVREAIKILKERGLVEPVNGVGAYVTKPDVQILSNMIYRYVLMDNVNIGQIYDTRILLEVNCARLAAIEATDAEIENMRSMLNQMEDRRLTVNERREVDYAFHEAIAEAARNPLNLILIKAFRNVFIAVIEKGIFMKGGIEDASDRHEKIMKAIEQHNPDAAEKAMRDHLMASCEGVYKFIEGKDKLPIPQLSDNVNIHN